MMSEGARAGSSPRTPSRQVRKPASGRGAYRDELFRLARRDDRILSVEADLGSGSSSFRKSFPDRFLNLGIAETAAIDVAVGLAAGGFVPFFSTFAPFATQRAAESIKLGLGYMGANVKIAAPYGGCRRSLVRAYPSLPERLGDAAESAGDHARRALWRAGNPRRRASGRPHGGPVVHPPRAQRSVCLTARRGRARTRSREAPFALALPRRGRHVWWSRSASKAHVCVSRPSRSGRRLGTCTSAC